MMPGMNSMVPSLFPGMSFDPSGAGMNPYMFPFGGAMPWGYPSGSSAASFHMQGPKNEIKLFVGGLQF